MENIELVENSQPPIQNSIEKPEEKTIKYKKISFRIIFVALGAYVGVFCRVLLSKLSKIAAPAVLSQVGTSFFLPNILGSFVIGIFHGKLMDKLKGPVLTNVRIGITTGFCGSCTTFASWHLYTSVILLQGKWLDSILLSFLTFSTSYMALLTGTHLSKFLTFKFGAETEINSNPSSNPDIKRNAVFCGVFVILTILIWVGVATETDNTRLGFWLALGFCPIGAVTRYLLSLKNYKYPNFPLFTLMANMIAATGNMCIIILGNYLLKHDYWIDNYKLWVSTGISTGCMGSLSTVSTFVNEIYKLSNIRIFYAYKYAILTIVLTHFICIILGVFWLFAGNEIVFL